MELWRELLIGGLSEENEKYEFINDEAIKGIIENKCYMVLLQIKKIIEEEKLSDKDCFFKIEKLLEVLEKNNIFCDRHDFG